MVTVAVAAGKVNGAGINPPANDPTTQAAGNTNKTARPYRGPRNPANRASAMTGSKSSGVTKSWVNPSQKGANPVVMR